MTTRSLSTIAERENPNAVFRDRDRSLSRVPASAPERWMMRSKRAAHRADTETPASDSFDVASLYESADENAFARASPRCWRLALEGHSDKCSDEHPCWRELGMGKQKSEDRYRSAVATRSSVSGAKAGKLRSTREPRRLVSVLIISRTTRRGKCRQHREDPSQCGDGMATGDRSQTPKLTARCNQPAQPALFELALASSVFCAAACLAWSRPCQVSVLSESKGQQKSFEKSDYGPCRVPA